MTGARCSARHVAQPRKVESFVRSAGASCSEKRLARVLLKLGRMRQHDAMPDAKIALVSHETLAEMVGTTRSRVTHFMNKFRTMGLIDYDSDGFTIRTELLTDLVLHD